MQFRFEDGKDQADNELVEFYQSVLSMTNPQNASKRKQGLGQVSPSHATLVSDIIKKETGKQMDVSDFEIVMDGSAVNHIEERHGKNGKADHSMEDEANIARIPWAMNNATQAEIMRDKDGNFDLDTAYKNADGSSSYKVKLERPIGNDRFYVVECVPDSARKQLIVKSAYIFVLMRFILHRVMTVLCKGTITISARTLCRSCRRSLRTPMLLLK